MKYIQAGLQLRWWLDSGLGLGLCFRARYSVGSKDSFQIRKWPQVLPVMYVMCHTIIIISSVSHLHVSWRLYSKFRESIVNSSWQTEHLKRRIFNTGEQLFPQKCGIYAVFVKILYKSDLSSLPISTSCSPEHQQPLLFCILDPWQTDLHSASLLSQSHLQR